MYPIDLESADGTRLEATVHPASLSAHLGTVVAAHDLGMDMDEGGMFLRLAERLAQSGFTTLRFSFRGHGGSDATQRNVTIADQVRDLAAAFDAAKADYPGKSYLLASGFGAVPAALSLPAMEDWLAGLVLWHPILDLRETFVEPRLPWGQANFGPAERRALDRDGFLLLDGEFELDRTLFEEIGRHNPVEPFVASRVPALVVHGDGDTRASHDTAATAAAARPDCQFHSIRGSDHGFQSRTHEDEALDVTFDWLTRRHGERL